MTDKELIKQTFEELIKYQKTTNESIKILRDLVKVLYKEVYGEDTGSNSIDQTPEKNKTVSEEIKETSKLMVSIKNVLLAISVLLLVTSLIELL